jgi:SAM-dependent methyltransferase
VTYNPRYLEIIPAEVLERDYGCGDPTPYVRPGDTVLDLGSGGGKVCFIAAQIAGPKGRVMGVDCNQEMLALARRHQPAVSRRLGVENIEFRCGLIQDLRLDLERLAEELAREPVSDQWGWLRARSVEERLRSERPMIPDESVDCVLSNCVLNLVRTVDRKQLFAEIFRVLKTHGRAAVSDIVADRDVPEHLQRDPHLWSGCVSGAYREDAFLRAFEEAGFHGIEITGRQPEPWQVVEGVEFRSLTVVAYKGERDRSADHEQSLIYRGPFRKVEDDEGHVFVRGERTAVGETTFRRLLHEPYQGKFVATGPADAGQLSDPDSSSCCGPDGHCSSHSSR